MKNLQHAGMTRGSFSVTKSGQSAYHIPIQVPAGTAKVEPSLALSYVGNQTNGLLGPGFTLSGLPSIDRVGQTMAQDQNWTAVSYTAQDRFTLAGERLVAVRGSYGAPGTEYRTERETWARIISFGEVGGGPEWFEVTNRNGRKMLFGADPTARVPITNGSPIRTWALSKVIDLCGNFYEVSYELDPTSGTHRPVVISYTGNQTTQPALLPNRRVIFSYESRPDPVGGYCGGHFHWQTQRLTLISTYVGDELVRTYTLGYKESSVTGRSELATLVEADGQGITLPPVTFTRPSEPSTWLEPGVQLSPVSDLPVVDRFMTLAGDLTGNGRTDIVRVWADESMQLAYAVFLAQVDGTFADPILGSTSCPFDGFSEGLTTLDINGNGRSDLILFYEWNNGLAYSTFIWEDNAFLVSDPFPLDLGLRSGLIPQLVPVDVNGDGKSDIFLPVAHLENSTLSYYLLISDGQRYTPQKRVDTTIPMYGDWSPMLMAANITGSPMQDIIYGVQGDEMEIYSFISTGSGYAVQDPLRLQTGSRDYVQLLPLVTTDDGLTDLAYIFQDGENTTLLVLMSDGTKIVQPPASTPIHLMNANPSAISPVNLTGDGRTDLLYYTYDGWGNVVVTPLLARNGSFVAQPSIETNLNAPFWSLITPDIRGVGKNDLLITTSDNTSTPSLQFHVFQAVASNIGLIENISNGVGGTIAIEYLSVSDPRVYSETDTKQTGLALSGHISSASTTPVSLGDGSSQMPTSPGWLRRAIEVPRDLVWKMKRSDGRGQVYESTLHYKDGLVSLDGRGWLGFASSTYHDLDAASTLVTTFYQEFPLIGIPTSKSTGWTGRSRALQVEQSQYEVKNALYPGVFAVHLHSQTITIYPEVFGEVSSHSTVSTYDDYGNCLTRSYSSPQAGAAADLYITQTFDNDTLSWCLGLLTTSVTSSDKLGLQPLRSQTFTYDPRTKKIETSTEWNSTDPADSPSTTHTYDPYGNLSTVASSNGALTTYIYEPATAYTYRSSRTRKVSDTTDLLDLYVYDPRFGVPTWHQDPNGQVRTWELDGLGRVSKAFGPGPDGTVVLQSTGWQFQEQAGYMQTTSQIQTWDGTLRRVVTRFFDGLGRPCSTIEQGEGGPPALPRIVEWQLDGRGKATGRSLPYQPGAPILWMKAAFDPLGRLIEKVRPLNQREQVLTRIWYAGLDRIAVHGQGSPNPVATSERHLFINGKAKVVERADGLGRISTFAYDALGRIKSATPPDGSPQTAHYDSLGLPRLVEGVDFGQVSTDYHFAERSQTVTYANGQRVRLKLDLLNRLSDISLSDGWNYVIGYDLPGPGNRMGRLASVTASYQGSELYTWLQEYDSSGRTSHIQLLIDGLLREQRRHYFPPGQLQELAFQDRSSALYTYDALGQLQDLTYISPAGKAQMIATYDSYTAFGKPQTGVAGNGVVKQWRYNERGQIRSIQVQSPGPDGRILFARLFHHDLFGRIFLVTDAATGKVPDRYTYDDAGQVQTWIDQAGVVQQCHFDMAGNVLSTGTRKVSYSGSSITVTPTTGQPYTLNYGVTGNRETRVNDTGPTTRYIYDARNALVEVNGTPSVHFLYDHRGRRLVKSNGAGERVIYLTSDDITAANGAGLTTVKLLRDPYGIPAVVETSSDQAQPRISYLAQDQIKSTILVTDESGAILSIPRYEPFGRLVNPTAGLSPFLPGFGGQPLDSETGFAYFNARYLDPEIGRFITADTRLGGRITATNALNRYTYALNDPINLADPSGHSVFDWLFSSIVDLLEIVGGIVAGIYGAEPVAGTLIGAGAGGLIYGAKTLATGQSFNWGTWGIAEGIGAAAGLTLGAGASELGGAGVVGDAGVAGDAGAMADAGAVGDAGDGGDIELLPQPADGGAGNDGGGNAAAANANGGPPEGTSIYNLPRDVRNSIASFLDRDDITSWRQTAKLFRDVGWNDADRFYNLDALPQDKRVLFINRIESEGYEPLRIAGVPEWDYLDRFDTIIVKDDPGGN